MRLAVLATLSIGALPSLVAAQPSAQAASERLLAEAETHVAAGDFIGAYERARRATALDGERADGWLAVAEIADHLRLDAVALEAYERYLRLEPESPRRAELSARAEVLRTYRGGGGYALAADGRTVRRLARFEDADVRPAAARRAVLVDWTGRPVHIERTTVPLAPWEGERGPRRPDRRGIAWDLGRP